MTVLEQPRTRQIRPWRGVLIALAGVLWLVGWLVGKVSLVVVWAFVAVKVGWLDARATPRRR